MSAEKIHLRKLLQLFYARDNRRISLLRSDIRNEIKKSQSDSDEGGDFHVPFWSDAKTHAAGGEDIRAAINHRIALNKSRARLYPLLGKGFLKWWDEKRRWRNEPFELLPDSIKSHYEVPAVGGTVKIENLLAIKVGDRYNRLVYPYFSEDPVLPEEGRRVGLWVINKGLPNFPISDLRILDVLRGSSYGVIDHPLQGNEEELFVRRYGDVLREWRKLWDEYQ